MTYEDLMEDIIGRDRETEFLGYVDMFRGHILKRGCVIISSNKLLVEVLNEVSGLTITQMREWIYRHVKNRNKLDQHEALD